MSKPRTDVAMQELIDLVRLKTPFDLSNAELCSGICQGCSKKLLEYLDSELEDWSVRLKHDEVPSFKDLNSLAKRSTKIYNALQRNNLV